MGFTDHIEFLTSSGWVLFFGELDYDQFGVG
jgi:hypothetical protein